jgi:hypothetical protein
MRNGMLYFASREKLFENFRNVLRQRKNVDGIKS